MSAAIKQSFKCAVQVLQPSFYKSIINKLVLATRKELEKNSVKPVFWAMGLISIVGYTGKYMMVESEFLEFC
jgi:hypothetical protein